eukprot:TRINITY_DN47351_c0_g1_i1.p1 TRINITY_DN47351_c0_g1~~TRINITY_DN47351_c0_g1_i1.p1  ORF type:complete len:517 (+),score=153.32 TRINITY_DN47351_c0_g1_i1:52-1602(+)
MRHGVLHKAFVLVAGCAVLLTLAALVGTLGPSRGVGDDAAAGALAAAARELQQPAAPTPLPAGAVAVKRCPFPHHDAADPAWVRRAARKTPPPPPAPTTEPVLIPKRFRVPYGDEWRYKVPPQWHTSIVHTGTQHYKITNFCVIKGRLTLYQKGLPPDTPARKSSFQLYNEFTRHKNPLKYVVSGPPLTRLPGPLVDNDAWMLSFWCQDMFHMTLTVMPAYLVKRRPDSDVYVRLCSGSPCRVKLGSKHSWDDGYNPRWKDKQFKTAGNPMWRMYSILTDHPSRLRPLYSHPSFNNDTLCYKEGIVDKKYINLVTSADVQNYTEAQFRNFGVRRTPRRCMREGGYRLTLINRLKSTRRLGNLDEVTEAAVCHGFNVSVLQFEEMPIREQMQVAANTDCLLGVHGNGLIWALYQERGAVEIEMAGVWYERYTHLAGGMHFHTTTRDKFGKKYNEWRPLHVNMTELRRALRRAKQHLDATACDGKELPPLSRDLAAVSVAISSRLKDPPPEPLEVEVD